MLPTSSYSISERWCINHQSARVPHFLSFFFAGDFSPGSLHPYFKPLTLLTKLHDSTTSIRFHSSMASHHTCGKHRPELKKVYRYILFGLFAFVLAVLLIILIIYLVLRPAKPSFTLQDATLYQFNLTSPNALSTILQITLFSANSNDRIGIYYDSLSAYASYAYQQVTQRTTLPTLYLDSNAVTSWSPFLSGSSVPVAPYVAAQLDRDQRAGAYVITVQAYGKLMWRVGSWVSGHYRLQVTCQAYMTYVGVGGNAGANMRLQQPVGCSTSV